MEILKQVTGLRMAACAALMTFSPAIFALGLGDAHVRSFLGQPLDLRIELISQSADELAAVTASLASADDFRLIGLDRTALSVPLRFEVNRRLPGPYIQVNSSSPVNEPVIQLVVQVTFANGRMLREYTLFLDPPTFAAPVPPPVTTPRNVQSTPPVPRPAQDEPVPRLAQVEPVTQETRVEAGETPAVGAEPAPDDPRVAAPAVSEAEPVPEVPPVPAAAAGEAEALQEPQERTAPVQAGDEPAETPDAPLADAMETPAEEAPTEEAGPQDTPEAAVGEEDVSGAGEAGTGAQEEQTDTVSPAPADTPPARDGPVEAVEAEPRRAPVVYQPARDSGEVYGPVNAGETMWGIASGFTRDTPYSINQAMLAIQRQNPEAFVGNNINALKRGAILRMPTLDQVAELSARDAMLEAMRQEEQYRARREGRSLAATPPAVAAAAEAAFEDTPEPAAARADPQVDEVSGRLELVPSNELTGGSAFGQGDGDAAGPGAGTGETARMELARIEEELANAQQENAYLAERIRELQEQITASEAPGTVADTGLAEMESSLREDRLSGETDEPVAVVPPGREDAWYAGKTWWMAGLVLVLVAALVWFLKRMSGADRPAAAAAPDHGAETVKSIKGEAEDILRVLDPHKAAPNSDATNVIDLERYVEPGERDETPEEPPQPPDEADPGDTVRIAPPQRPLPDEEAVELDASDPETKLDLARAYISMGDEEAAREMLEEVIADGNEDQVREAKGMMTEL